MFNELYLKLKNEFSVFSIGQHKGLCEEPYLVLRETGEGETSKSLLNSNIEILVYFPFGRYSEINAYVQGVKIALNKLGYNRVYNNIPTVIDSEKQAYMTVLSYRKIKLKEV